MSENKFSREYLLQQCHIKRHCLCLRFNKPLRISNNEYTNKLYAIDINGIDLIMQNYLNHKNTYGKIKITAFLPNKNPISDSFTINICTSWIDEIEIRDEPN